MPNLRSFLLPAFLLLTPPTAKAAELLACVVAGIPDNPTYNGMATTLTKLKCELPKADYYPTLPELYRQGWRLLQAVRAELTLCQAAQVPSPLYYLEREAAAAPTPIAPKK